jgi:hypothetical protein
VDLLSIPPGDGEIVADVTERKPRLMLLKAKSSGESADWKGKNRGEEYLPGMTRDWPATCPQPTCYSEDA